MASKASISMSTQLQQVLKAQVNDVRILGTLLRPIAIAAVANVNVSEAGLRVVTELDRCVQAVAYVSTAIFSCFEFHPPDDRLGGGNDGASSIDSDWARIDFDINLNTLLECINIFGGAPPGASSASWQEKQQRQATSKSAKHNSGGGVNKGRFIQAVYPAPPDLSKATTMLMRWKGPGFPLVLLLEEQEVVTRCELATYQPGFAWNLAYNHEDTQAQTIMSSDCLLDALQGIDSGSSSKITLLFSNTYVASRHHQSPRVHRRDGTSPRAPSSSSAFTSSPSLPVSRPTFKILSDGAYGTTETELPDTASVLEKFSCARETSYSYRYSHFAHLNKALQASIRVSLRVSDKGLLSVQLMMPKGTGAAQQSATRHHAAAPTTAAGASSTGHGFLEFLIAPLDEEFEEEEENGRDDQTSARSGEETIDPPNAVGGGRGDEGHDDSGDISAGSPGL